MLIENSIVRPKSTSTLDVIWSSNIKNKCKPLLILLYQSVLLEVKYLQDLQNFFPILFRYV